MKTHIAWWNVIHDKRRTAAAVAGVAFAILLIFMQLGFYSGALISATMIYDAFAYDAILHSPPYVHLLLSGTLPLERAEQARVVPGVAAVTPVYVGGCVWKNTIDGVNREVLMLGVNPSSRPFRNAQLNADLDKIKRPYTVLMDRVAKPLVGPHKVGTRTEVNGRQIEVVGDYTCGTGLLGDGALLTSDLTFSRLMGLGSVDRPQFLMVRFQPAADPKTVLAALAAALPKDTKVRAADQLRNEERHYFIHVKPVGFMFLSGLIIGLLVGAVIVYQILSADIAKRIPQYATLKAMGYGPHYLYGVILSQGFLFAVFGFIPALILSIGLFAVVRQVADLPVYVTLGKAALVLTMSVCMCSVSGLLAMRKVNVADPADLFR